jgi:hypothetical protein
MITAMPGRCPRLSTPDVELGLHVVDVHAGADDPAPRLEQFDIGGFSTGAGAGLRPAVIDDAGALGLATLAISLNIATPSGSRIAERFWPSSLGLVGCMIITGVRSLIQK